MRLSSRGAANQTLLAVVLIIIIIAAVAFIVHNAIGTSTPTVSVTPTATPTQGSTQPVPMQPGGGTPAPSAAPTGK